MAQPAYQYGPSGQAVPARRWGWGSLAARIVLTFAGAAGLIVGAFLHWIRGISGVDLTGRAFIQTTFRDARTFVVTAGFAMIVVGLVAILGLAPRSGWLTRLAGAVGIAGFVLFMVQVYRAHLTAADVQAGAWVALAGAVVALIGGFLGTRPAEVAPAPPAPAAPAGTVVE